MKTLFKLITTCIIVSLTFAGMALGSAFAGVLGLFLGGLAGAGVASFFVVILAEVFDRMTGPVNKANARNS